MVKKPAPVTASSQRLVWARKVDDIDVRMKSKIEVLSGFKDVGGQAKKMIDLFLFYDKSGSGYLTYEQVSISLKKLNFLGIQREVEAWFNYYDDDFTGAFNYTKYAKQLYALDKDAMPSFDFSTRGTLEDIRSKMVEIGGASGFFDLKCMLNARKDVSTGTISRMELVDCITAFGIGSDAVSDENMKLLLNAFDPKHNQVVDVGRFITALIVGTMSLERKIIVRESFNSFRGAQEMGYVSVRDLVSHFSANYHPEVISGNSSLEDARDQFQASFSQGGEAEGYVTLAEYLDFFKGLSLAVTSDHAFDMMVRNIVQFPEDAMDASMSLHSSPTNRRLLVTHSDGKQEVVDLLDEMGKGRFDIQTAKERAQSQGVQDIATLSL